MTEHEPDHRDLEEMTNREMPAGKDYKLVKVRDIRPGDMVDLEGDKYADPDSDPGKGFEFQYALVCEKKQETDDCIVLYFEEDSPVGFPVDHELKVGGHDKEYDE